MRQDTQAEVIGFLKSVTGDGAAGPARVIDTHISVVVLKGAQAWKLKRALLLPYADFSTPARRLAACEREVVLNRRTAPSIYSGVRRITRQADGGLAFDGPGELVDAVVDMHRFDDGTLFSELAVSGGLTRPLLTELARHIAAFHDAAEVRSGGGAANIAAILDLNEQDPFMAPLLGEQAVNELRTALRAGLAQHGERLDARAQAGRIRLCHGDLHLRNLCLVDGRPTLFDCIEFNDALASIDVYYDLAFLLMDLWQAGLRDEANWVMNRYLDASGDQDGLPLLPFLMALRASIRALVLATQATQSGRPDTPQRQELAGQAQAYLSLAMDLLEPVPTRLLAVGGLSGSGKSTLCAALAPGVGAAPGARVLASDRLRKAMAGVTAETRLPAESYTLESSQKVYAALYAQAAQTLGDGYSVIADAVFSRLDERQAIEACAAQAGRPFLGVWLETDPQVLLARIASRRDDASDATAQVLQAQLAQRQPVPEWLLLPAGESVNVLRDQVLATLEAAAGAGTAPPAWALAPPGWNWRAQDEDGRWYWYAVEPQLGLPGGIWRAPRRAQQLAAPGAPNPLWYETCQRRPEP